MKKFLMSFTGTLMFLSGFSQETYLYEYHTYQKINSRAYSPDSSFHTSIYPVMPSDGRYRLLDSVFQVPDDSVQRSWVHRKLFHEHLVEIRKDDFNVLMDVMSDFQVGKDRQHQLGTWLNTRGIQVQGTIGKKFSFYTSAYENQGRFPAYLRTFIDTNKIIPGQVNDKFGPSRTTKDWAYATALLNYTPNKYFSFTLGQDKNFIGDGYRSMLFSDLASNYPFFKIETTLGRVKYVNIWAQFQDLKAAPLSYENGFRKKWGVFHYLDWNITNRASIGFFESVIWQNGDESGKRGFDVSYLVPVIFLRTVEGYNGSPDNALLGFNGKYKIGKNVTAYGQFLLDEFTAKEFFAGNGYWANKFGAQLGFKVFDALKIKNLNLLAEYNTARPFTYSQRTSLLNYAHYNQALAHPFGANFKEVLGMLDYSYKRWQFSAQGNVARYGLDALGENYGKDIFKSYNSRSDNYGNSTGQGIRTNFFWLDSRLAFIINPKINFRLEAGAIYRKESNFLKTDKTTWLTFGLRTSFRGFYQDF